MRMWGLGEPVPPKYPPEFYERIKEHLPDGMELRHVDIVENLELLEKLLSNGWVYDTEDNLYDKKINGHWCAVGLSLMGDNKLYGRVYGGGMSNPIGGIGYAARVSSYDEVYVKLKSYFNEKGIEFI